MAEPLVVRTGADTPETILATKTVSEADLLRAREVGAAMAAGLAMGIF